jgi:hypothetical protein
MASSTANRSKIGFGYTGYPASIFLGKLNYGFGPRSHFENMTILKKWWSDLESYIPVFAEDKKNSDKFNPKTIDEKITEAFTEVGVVQELYRSDFEGLGTCSPQEKSFILACDGLFYRLNRITAQTHIVDKETDEGTGMNV